MSTLFQRASSFLSRTLPSVAGGNVIIKRGDSQAWTVATWGRSEFQVDTPSSVQVMHTDRDFLIAAADYLLDGQRATPQKGDRITVVEDGATDQEIYEVCAPAGTDVFRFSDPEGNRLRIYTARCQ